MGGRRSLRMQRTLPSLRRMRFEVRIMNEMNNVARRGFSGAVATSALLLLAGCGAGSGSGPSADSELSALANSISSLASTVERFKSDDWKDVVPDVESDTADVATAFANLKAAMGKS